MARYRLSNVTLEFDLAAAGVTPVPVPIPTPAPDPDPDPNPEPTPEPGPAPTPSPNPAPAPVGNIPIHKPQNTTPPVPSSMWGYTEPPAITSLLEAPAGSPTFVAAHGQDGDDADSDPDPIEMGNLLGFPAPFDPGARPVKNVGLAGLPGPMENASGAHVNVTEDGIWPVNPDWRVSKSLSVSLKQGGVYHCLGTSLPNGKGMFSLGIPDPASQFALQLNGAELHDAKLGMQDKNGAVVRVTRCAVVLVQGPGKFINCQMPILHDGQYNGVKGQRFEMRDVHSEDAGVDGRQHHVYTQLELEEVLLFGCTFLRVKGGGNFVQIRGRQSLIEGCTFIYGDSNASRVANWPHNGLHTFRNNTVIFGPGRSNVAPFGLGTSSGKEAQNHKGPNGYHIHDNVFDFRQAGGNLPTGTGMCQLGLLTPKEWLNWHDNQIVTG